MLVHPLEEGRILRLQKTDKRRPEVSGVRQRKSCRTERCNCPGAVVTSKVTRIGKQKRREGFVLSKVRRRPISKNLGAQLRNALLLH